MSPRPKKRFTYEDPANKPAERVVAPSAVSLLENEKARMDEELQSKEKVIGRLIKENEKLKAIQTGLEDDVVRLQHGLQALRESKTALITIDGAGNVHVDLDGPWTFGDNRRVLYPLQKAIRQIQVDQRPAGKGDDSEETGEDQIIPDGPIEPVLPDEPDADPDDDDDLNEMTDIDDIVASHRAK